LRYFTPEEVRFAAELLRTPRRLPLINLLLTGLGSSFRKIGIACVILGGVFWFVQSSGSVDSSGKTVTTSASAEQMPMFGTGNALSEAQIKYCLAEQIPPRWSKVSFESAIRNSS
jgi:hypothetical protein